MDQKKTARGKNRKKLKNFILTNMVIVPFIPFILSIGVSFYYLTATLETKTVNALKRIVEDHRQMIDSFLMERKSDLELIAGIHGFEQMRIPGAINPIFDKLKIKSDAFVDLGVFDSQGLHISYAGRYRLEGKNYQDEPWFKKVLENGFYISDVFLGYRMIPHFIIAVRQGDKNRPWILRATIDTHFFDQLVSQIKIGLTGEAFILNEKGSVQAIRRGNGLQILDIDPDFKEYRLPETGINTFIRSDFMDTSFVYAATWMKNREWLLMVRQEKKDVYKALYTAAYISLMITVVGGAVIIVMAVFTTNRILSNMDRLGMEKENLGHQLIRATQLAEIGEMATGFAHEINNPLQIIKGEHALIESLLEDTPVDKNEITDSLNQIKLQVNRCSDITHSILKFGRKNEVKTELLHPGLIIPEIVRMIEKKAKVNGIRVILNIQENLHGFFGDSSQFQQVMLNLINNAMDAIFEHHGSSGGMLKISAGQKDDSCIQIRIEDNGSGIHPENMEKIFSPFFTTKPVGKGTGLGLSVCYGIVKNFGGTMSVESRLDHGTTFIIGLPSNA